MGWANTLPLGRGNRNPIQIEGTTSEVTDTRAVDTNVVSPGYFYTLALESTEGRFLDSSDSGLAPPVAVVDELMAQRYFGPRAVGATSSTPGATRVEIVGIVRSGRYRTLQQEPQATSSIRQSGLPVSRVSRHPYRTGPGPELDAIRAAVAFVGAAPR